MSYFSPQPCKCTKCGFETKIGDVEYWKESPSVDGIAVCPKCWKDFLEQFGKMYCTIDFTGKGSQYELKKASEK